MVCFPIIYHINIDQSYSYVTHYITIFFVILAEVGDPFGDLCRDRHGLVTGRPLTWWCFGGWGLVATDNANW
jgi:hypothetical protein